MRPKWSKERVVEAIQERHCQRLPLSSVWREYPSLFSVAKRLFGSWRNAIRAAGVPLHLPHTWTREEIIAAIQHRQTEGLPMTSMCRENPSLYGAAKKWFGGWVRALRAAGVPATLRTRWTRDLVIAAIRAHRRDGSSLSHIWREDRQLFCAACQRFGNWQNALQAAGVRGRQRRRWSRERVIEELRAWHDRSQANIRLLDVALAGAAYRLFGSLRAAQEVAGLEPTYRRWSPQRVIAAIQDSYGRGLPIHCPGFGDLGLASAAIRRYGSWTNAVAAAGLASQLPVPKPVRTWTKQGVVGAIRGQHQQGLGTKAIWKRDTGLYSAAKKHFGTWRAAVTAAGFEPAQQTWSRDRIVQEIQAWHQAGVRVSSISSQSPRLTTAAIRIFGGWRNALAAAGLHVQKKDR